MKKSATFNSLGERSCEIKGGNGCNDVNVNSIDIAAISGPPHLISQLFSPRLLKAAPFSYSLAVLCVYILSLFVLYNYGCFGVHFYPHFFVSTDIMVIIGDYISQITGADLIFSFCLPYMADSYNAKMVCFGMLIDINIATPSRYG